MHIGLKIKDIIQKNDINVQELSKRLGVTRQYLYKIYQKEHVSTEILEQLASALTLDITQFFTQTSDSKSNEDLIKLNKELTQAIDEIKTLKENIERLNEKLENKEKLLLEKEKLIGVYESRIEDLIKLKEIFEKANAKHKN